VKHANKKDNRLFWDRFAFLYDCVVGKDGAAYERVYALMEKALNKDMRVLELATGTGIVALRIAGYVKSVDATDFSKKMIEAAKRKPAPGNVSFNVADACALAYEDASFDAAVVSNALHIMPRPEPALESIRRVLKPEGVLIAPTYTHGSNTLAGRICSAVMRAAGLRIYNLWTSEEYPEFIERNGFKVTKLETIPAAFPLTYAEARVWIT
jgi:ubiquinone/menaquinone biosynthesis C-methylase UbiE